MHDLMGYLLATLVVLMLICLIGLMSGLALQMYMDFVEWRKKQ